MYQERNMNRNNLTKFLEAVNRQLTEEENTSCKRKLTIYECETPRETTKAQALMGQLQNFIDLFWNNINKNLVESSNCPFESGKFKEKAL